MSSSLLALTAAAALGCATVGGAFFAFSGFVMAGLARLPASQGIAAMQSINVTAVRPPLMIALFGSAVACAVVPVVGAAQGADATGLLLTGGGLYLVGTVAVTVAHHVRLNDALDRADPADPDAEEVWQGYLRSWTAGNHVRAAAALGATAAFVVAIAR